MTSKFFKLFTLLVFASVLLVSCNKEEDVQPQVETPVVETPVTGGGDEEPAITPPSSDNSAQINALFAATETEGCYLITLPITFLYEDGTSVTIETEADLEDIFNEDAENFPWQLGFPVNLINPETGDTETAADEEELFNYFMECEDFDGSEWDEENDPWDGENPCDSIDFGFGTFGCYELVFPLNFELEDGSIITATDENELNDIFFNGVINFAYPMNLQNEEGDILVANSEEELFTLLEECEDFDGGGNGGGGNGGGNGGNWDNAIFPLTFMSVSSDQTDFPVNCYSYVYPVSVINGDGDVTTVNSDEEIVNAVFGSDESVDFVYPVSLTDVGTGETLTINNEEEAIALVLACEG